MLVTGWGASDTHAITLSDGTENRHPSAGTPYKTVSLQEICNMLAEPPRVDKSKGQWIIPSSYHDHDARSHSVQSEHGEYHALVVDIDKGNHPLSKITEVLGIAFGDIWYAAWSTPSSSEINKKWRVLIPVNGSLTGKEYSAYQASLFDALEHFGVICDRTLERPGQVLYLPNRGEFYEWRAAGAAMLDARGHHGLSQRAGQYLAIAAEQGTASTVAANEGTRSFLRAFRAKHSIESLLALYGFEQSPTHPDLWRHPDQSTSTYGSIRIMRYPDSDRWVSLSETVNATGVGKPTGHGTRSGDAFDLYMHYNCAGNRNIAEAYAKQCLSEEDEKRYGDATILHGNQIWDSLCRAKAENAMMQARMVVEDEIELDDKEGNNSEWKLAWPPGAVGELAKWIYLSSSRPIKQYSVAAALYFFAASARKYNIEGSGLNLYMMLVGETGRGKGVVKGAIDRITHAIVEEAQDPNLIGPFQPELSVSESGIRKELGRQNPICAYEEELGLSLISLTSAKASSNDIGLRKILTRLFDSGQHRFLGRKAASDKDRERDMVAMPTLTLAGDTQPHIFRALLGGGMVDAGFAPRMIPFFYYGARKYHNVESREYRDPPHALVLRLKSLLEYSIRSGEVVVQIPWDTPEVEKAYYDVDIEYTDIINQGAQGAEMFNRAQAIIGRVAGLIAVGKNHLNPRVDMECFDYAKAMVWHGLQEAQRILATGGAGSGETVRIHAIRTAAKDFVTGKVNPDAKMRDYKTPRSIIDNPSIINDRYFIRRLGEQLDFKGSETRTTEQNVREAIKEAIAQGILEPANLAELNIIPDKRTKQLMYILGPDF